MWRLAACFVLLLLPTTANSQSEQDTAEPEWPDWNQPGWDAATIYAVLDANEWCPGGSVHIDLWTGEYALIPRIQRPHCSDPAKGRRPVHGQVSDAELVQLRRAYRALVIAGTAVEECNIVVSNGGPELVSITGPAIAMMTPEDRGCWSDEAEELHDLVFDIFGEPLPATAFDDLDGWQAAQLPE